MYEGGHPVSFPTNQAWLLTPKLDAPDFLRLRLHHGKLNQHVDTRTPRKPVSNLTNWDNCWVFGRGEINWIIGAFLLACWSAPARRSALKYSVQYALRMSLVLPSHLRANPKQRRMHLRLFSHWPKACRTPLELFLTLSTPSTLKEKNISSSMSSSLPKPGIAVSAVKKKRSFSFAAVASWERAPLRHGVARSSEMRPTKVPKESTPPPVPTVFKQHRAQTLQHMLNGIPLLCTMYFLFSCSTWWMEFLPNKAWRPDVDGDLSSPKWTKVGCITGVT